MTALRKVLLVLHLVGIGSPPGGFVIRMSAATGRTVIATLHGVLMMLVSGPGLYFVVKDGLQDDVNSTEIAVEPTVPAGIAGLIWINRGKESISKDVSFAIDGLTLWDIVIAVFWTWRRGKALAARN